MSKTPKTDMEIETNWMHAYVEPDFARKLERERDELQHEVDLLKKTPLRQRCQELEKLADHWCDMHTIAAKERDEAMDMLSKLSHFLGCGIGDENTTAKQFYDRIVEGFVSNNNRLEAEKKQLI